MIRTLAVGVPRWAIVSADLPPDIPAAVFHANRVVSSSPEALSYGIKRGIRRRDAQARCPELEVLQHDPARDARTFERIVTVVETFSPLVEVVRPGLCVVASRGPARYFGGEEALRMRVADAVDDTIETMRTNELHLDDRCRTGIADGHFAAALAAARGLIVEPMGSRRFLAPFAVGVLDQPDLCDLFRRLGVRTLGDLAGLPRDRVVARFGLDGVVAHHIACAEEAKLLEPRAIPPDLVITRELDPPAQRVDIAMFSGKSAADELAERLLALGMQCAKLKITVQTEHGEERTRTWRYSAAFTPTAIAERLRWQLEGWLADGARAGAEGGGVIGLSGGIQIVRLEPEDVGPIGGDQPGLWSRRGDVSDRVRRAIARVQGLLGQRGAQQPTLSGGRHPSEQVHLVPWGDPVEPARAGLPGTATVAGPVTVELPPWPGRLPAPSPAVVHDTTLGAEVVDDTGEMVRVTARLEVTTTPTRVRISGKRWTDVTGWAGPWPVDERWWDPTSHKRRARFQVTLSDGTAHLLSLEQGKFRVEATYD